MEIEILKTEKGQKSSRKGMTGRGYKRQRGEMTVGVEW